MTDKTKKRPRRKLPHGWRLMRSAPRDGTAVLVCFVDPKHGPITRSAYFGGLDWHENDEGGWDLKGDMAPTHWQPYPKPIGARP